MEIFNNDDFSEDFLEFDDNLLDGDIRYAHNSYAYYTRYSAFRQSLLMWYILRCEL